MLLCWNQTPASLVWIEFRENPLNVYWSRQNDESIDTVQKMLALANTSATTAHFISHIYCPIIQRYGTKLSSLLEHRVATDSKIYMCVWVRE